MANLDRSLASQWLGEICADIKEKYNISNPLFRVEEKIEENKENIVDWIHVKLCKNKWVQYKIRDNQTFELKERFPNPPDAACLQKINYLIGAAKNNPSNSIYYYELNHMGVLYDENQAKKEILFTLREGYSEIYTHAPRIDLQGRKIYGLSFSDIEYYWMLDSGYLVLEQK